MDRIDDPTAAADLFGSGKDGFSDGDPGLVDPTIVPADWLNGVQEEILALIEQAGLTPSNANLHQMLQAVRRQRYATIELTAGSLSSDTDSPLTVAASHGGFSINGGTLIAFPVLSIYRIKLVAEVSSADTSDPVLFDLRFVNSSGTTFGARAAAHRADGTAGTILSVSTEYVGSFGPLLADQVGVRNKGGNITIGNAYLFVQELYRS